MEPYTFFLASSLEKVFPDQKPDALAEGAVCTAWRGTRAGVQLVFHSQAGAAAWRFKVAVSGAPQTVSHTHLDVYTRQTIAAKTKRARSRSVTRFRTQCFFMTTSLNLRGT